MKISSWKLIVACLVLSLFMTTMGVPAAEAALISYRNSQIEITSPSDNGDSYENTVEVRGTSSLATVWLYAKGPTNEGTLYPIEVHEGMFAETVHLRFGPGKYIFWAGDNNRSFDGTVRFEVECSDQQDNRFIAPSSYVDSDHPEIVKLARQIVNNADTGAEGAEGVSTQTELEKVAAIHDWVAKNVSYDYSSYLANDLSQKKSSQVLADKNGVCSGYSALVAALARAAGMPARIVFGTAQDSNNAPQTHAWVEVMVDDQWLDVDATWDAGYVQNGEFVFSFSREYFNPTPEGLALTHTTNQISAY